MDFKDRLNLKLLFSREGYRISFDKKEYKHENGKYVEVKYEILEHYILFYEYLAIACFVVASLIMACFEGIYALPFILLFSILPLSFILVLNTDKCQKLIQKCRKIVKWKEHYF